MARPRAGAAPRRPRPRHHHRLPSRVQRGRARPSRPDRHQPRVSGVQGSDGARALCVTRDQIREFASSKSRLLATSGSQTNVQVPSLQLRARQQNREPRASRFGAGSSLEARKLRVAGTCGFGAWDLTCSPLLRHDPHLLRTPCVLVDQARVERNIERMQDARWRRGKRLRPHAKTHKSPDLALTADRARRGWHLLRQAGRGGGLRRPSRRRHPHSLSAQSGQRRSGARPSRSHAPLVHRRPSRGRARLVRA